MNTTLVADIGTFDTDFGVKFGHFICFDIMFDHPALDLVNMGVKNFAYPSMWYSDIPFCSGNFLFLSFIVIIWNVIGTFKCTAVQVHQNWAYSNNVNLLGAGANNPCFGSTGTGIFAGRQGALKSVFQETETNRILVSRITKKPGTNTNLVRQKMATSSPSILLTKEDINVHEFAILNESITSEQEHNLCYNGLCCNFKVQMNKMACEENSVCFFIVGLSPANNIFSLIVKSWLIRMWRLLSGAIVSSIFHLM